MPVGLLWSALAPRADVRPAGAGGLDFVDIETKDFIAGDGTMFLLCLAAGLLCAAVAWRFSRRPSGTVVGVVLGSAGAAWLAWRVGMIGEDRSALLAAARAGRITGVTDLPLQLRARTVLLAWPGAAALALAVLSFRGTGRHAADEHVPAPDPPGLDEPGPQELPPP